MKKRVVLLLALLIFLSLIFLVTSFWSVLGLLVMGFGVYHYLRVNKGQSAFKRPLLVIWSGVFLAFVLAVATVDTESAINQDEVKAEEENEKVQQAQEAEEARLAAEAKVKEEEEARIAAEAKVKEEEEARIAAEAKAKEAEEARLAAEAKVKEEEEARLAAEAKIKEEEEARIAAEAQAKEEARLAAEAQAKEEEKARIAAEAQAKEEARLAAEAQAKEEAQAAAQTEQASSSNLQFDPFGADRDCGDFSNGSDAQEFYLAAGGPTSDPHDLDRDNDGNACDWN